LGDFKTMDDWAAFRLDASEKIGMRHFMRCLTLAARLKKEDVKICFFMRHTNDELSSLAHQNGIKVIKLEDKRKIEAYGDDSVSTEHKGWLEVSQAQDAGSFMQAVTEQKLGPPNMVIVDHYALDNNWEMLVRAIAKVPIFAIDDLCNRKHDCDYFLDPTLGRSREEYEAYLPENCTALLGTNYALLRSEFHEQRELQLPKRLASFEKSNIPKTVLITMGSTDPNNVVLNVLEAFARLDKPNKPKLLVMLGAMFPHRAGLINWVKTSGLDTEIVNQTNQVSQLMGRADICISSMGTAIWERCCVGLPSINIVTNKSQKQLARSLIGQNFLVDAGEWKDIKPSRFAIEHLSPLLEGKMPLLDMATEAAEICDGMGTDRVFSRIRPKFFA